MFSVFLIMALEHVAEISLTSWREDMGSAVNVLPNNPNTSDLTNRDVFQLNVSKIKFELENIPVSQIWSLRTVWQYIDCQSHVFSSLFEINFCKGLKRHYLKTGKRFFIFFLHFRYLNKILRIFKKNIMFLA